MMPGDEQPLVSVVIPAYNAERFIGDAIESVLGQGYSNMEVIVVNDGSSDQTRPIVAGYGDQVRLIDQQNEGVSRARNHGIRAASGRFIAFLDADDVWMPSKVEAQVEHLENHPDIGFVYTGYTVVDENLSPLDGVSYPDPRTAWRNTLLLEPPVIWISSTSMFRADLLQELDGFDERLSTSADTDVALRAGCRRPLGGLPSSLVLYRQHGKQMHHDPDAMARDMDLVLERLFSDPHCRLSAGLRRRARGNLHATLAIAYARSHRHRLALRHAMLAMRRNPGSVFAVIGKGFTRRLRAGSAGPATSANVGSE